MPEVNTSEQLAYRGCGVKSWLRFFFLVLEQNLVFWNVCFFHKVLVIIDVKPKDLGLPTEAYISVEEVHDVSI